MTKFIPYDELEFLNSVEKCHEFIKAMHKEYLTEIERLREENGRFRKALEWLASTEGSCFDCHDVAQDALEGK